MKTLKTLTLLAALAATAVAALAAPLTEGEVKKVDKENRKVTLKHGEIQNLGMPPMTMVFKVQDPAVLDKLQPGDKVRFAADRVNGSIIVTEIEAAK
jgi:Cu(I)/Ag(I) efflux system protein CusF